MAVNQSAPSATIVPILIYSDVGQAVDWLTQAFGFGERLRVERSGVVFHAQLVFGDGALILGRAGHEYHPPRAGEVSQYVHVAVDDVDSHCDRAKAGGARIIEPPNDKPFGERQYVAEDLEGHRWTFSQHILDTAPEQWGAKVFRA